MEKLSDYAIIRNIINEHEIKLSDLEEEENRIIPKTNGDTTCSMALRTRIWEFF